MSDFSKQDIKQEPKHEQEQIPLLQAQSIKKLKQTPAKANLNLTLKQKNRNLLLDRMIENQFAADNDSDNQIPAQIQLQKTRKKYVRKVHAKPDKPRELRSNTNPTDFEYKDKINARTGNGLKSDFKTWLTKKFF